MEVTKLLLPTITNGLTKEKVRELASASVSLLLEEGNVIESIEAIKAMEEFIKAYKEDERFKNYAVEEIGKFGKGLTTPSGAKIELAEVGTTYNYAMCGDPVYINLIEQKIQLDAKIKEREKFLKAIPESGLDSFDANTGEAYKIYPPSKQSTSSFKVTLK